MAIFDLPVPKATCDNCFRGRTGHPLDHEGPCERDGARPEWVLDEDAAGDSPPRRPDPSGLPPGRMVIAKQTLYFCSTACSMAHGRWERAWAEAEETCTVPDGEYDRLEVKLDSGRYLVAFVPQAMTQGELAQSAAELQGISLTIGSIEKPEPEVCAHQEVRWWDSSSFHTFLRVFGLKAGMTALTLPLVLGQSPAVAWCLAFVGQFAFEALTLVILRFAFKQRVGAVIKKDDGDGG